MTKPRLKKTLFATADHLGHHALFAIDVATGEEIWQYDARLPDAAD